MQLPVADDVPLPATLDDWRALTLADREELYAAWTDEVLVDVSTSELLAAVPALPVVTHNGRPHASLHVVLKFYARLCFVEALQNPPSAQATVAMR